MDLFVVRSREEDAVVVFKTLQSLDETSPDIFWFFENDFMDANSYVTSVVESFRTRVELLSKRLEQSGDPPWPPLAGIMTDLTAPPLERVRALLAYADERTPEGLRLVVALLPLEIAKPLGWRAFLRELLSSEDDDLLPWWRHLRLIAREPQHVENVSPELEARLDPTTFPNTEVCPIDFRAEALEEATKEEIADTRVPLADRMQSLLMDANYDVAHKRYLEAGEKYQLLRQYYAARKEPAMLAVSLNGLGEVHVAASAHLRDQARDYFEMAVTAAVEGKSYPILLHVALNLANLYRDHQEWSDAAEHYEAAEALATALLNAHVKLYCLENIGICRHQLAEWGPAHKAWQDGVTLARSLREDDTRKKLLVHLRDLYMEARMHDSVEAMDDELRSLP